MMMGLLLELAVVVAVACFPWADLYNYLDDLING